MKVQSPKLVRVRVSVGQTQPSWVVFGDKAAVVSQVAGSVTRQSDGPVPDLLGVIPAYVYECCAMIIIITRTFIWRLMTFKHASAVEMLVIRNSRDSEAGRS